MTNMDVNFWHEKWKNNQIGFHSPQVNAKLTQFADQAGIQPNTRVFVPLCGKSLDLMWLKNRGCRVTGVELSPIAIESFYSETQLKFTKQETSECLQYNSGRITLFQSDFFQLSAEILQETDVIYDRAALIALPADLRKKYVAKLDQYFPSEITILLITLEYPQNEMNGPPFSVTEEEVNELYGQRFKITKLHSDNILTSDDHFKQSGLSLMYENVYLLKKE